MIPDSHAHLDLIEEETGKVVASAITAGVSPIVTIGIDIPSSIAAVRLAGTYDSVYCSVGIHPNDTEGIVVDDFDRLQELALSSKRVVAIGETGLDYYRDRSPAEKQCMMTGTSPWISAARSSRASSCASRSWIASALPRRMASAACARKACFCFSAGLRSR